ncbi:MAG: DUF6807 family protein [Bryobacterales bacterium]|nr:PmoA family protein [Bryobacteraceae bacterium]MDW8129879.1 DUF6807 family protein [Bryobacterales bacterium]
MMWWIFVIAPLVATESPFAFREIGPGRLQLSERDRPVFVYNYGLQLKPGVPEDRRRCCYVHPVWTPAGTVVTDDFPADHYHHRGIFWAWPRVSVAGQTRDLWTLRGIEHRFVRWHAREVFPDRARLEVENGWFVEDRQVLRERVAITAHRAQRNARRMEVSLVFEALEPLEIGGEPAQNKGYGGFSIRFGPRRKTLLRTDTGVEQRDSDMGRHAWAELEGDFDGRRASVRIEIDPGHPGYPNGWCLRHYGFLGVNYPGLATLGLKPGRPLGLSYHVIVADR